jgi:hypothetical protein
MKAFMKEKVNKMLEKDLNEAIQSQRSIEQGSPVAFVASLTSVGHDFITLMESFNFNGDLFYFRAPTRQH